MEIKTHPTHAKNTKKVMVGLGIVAISGWGIAMAIGQHDKKPEIVNICVLFSIASVFGILIISSLRAFLIQCPTCKKLITNQIDVNVSTESRKFCCEKCNIIWDSKVKYEFGSD